MTGWAMGPWDSPRPFWMRAGAAVGGWLLVAVILGGLAMMAWALTDAVFNQGDHLTPAQRIEARRAAIARESQQ